LLSGLPISTCAGNSEPAYKTLSDFVGEVSTVQRPSASQNSPMSVSAFRGCRLASGIRFRLSLSGSALERSGK
jgi:hypothetical protein